MFDIHHCSIFDVFHSATTGGWGGRFPGKPGCGVLFEGPASTSKTALGQAFATWNRSPFGKGIYGNLGESMEIFGNLWTSLGIFGTTLVATWSFWLSEQFLKAIAWWLRLCLCADCVHRRRGDLCPVKFRESLRKGKTPNMAELSKEMRKHGKTKEL